MSNIEVIVVLLLLFMAVPDWCRKLGRPALAYPVFVMMGLLLQPIVPEGVVTMLKEAGQLGFLLLLFEVGLEIDLPRFREFVPALRQAMKWILVQVPVAVLLAMDAGLTAAQVFLAVAALTGCSVGMAHSAWKGFPFGTAEKRALALQVMVALELMSIVSMSVGSKWLGAGVSWWIVVHLLGMGVAVYLLARYAAHLEGMFQRVLERTTHWRMHWLALLLLSICAVGDRLGLAGSKTAFVLGLCLSRAKHRGMNVEEVMAPLSRRFLIPLFFVSLGLGIEWGMITGWMAVKSAGAAALLLGVREVVNRRWLGEGRGVLTYLLYSPNLTLVALAANSLVREGGSGEVVVWLLLTGLLVTVPSIALMPAEEGQATSGNGSDPGGGRRNLPP